MWLTLRHDPCFTRPPVTPPSPPPVCVQAYRPDVLQKIAERARAEAAALASQVQVLRKSSALRDSALRDGDNDGGDDARLGVGSDQQQPGDAMEVDS